MGQIWKGAREIREIENNKVIQSREINQKRKNEGRHELKRKGWVSLHSNNKLGEGSARLLVLVRTMPFLYSLLGPGVSFLEGIYSVRSLSLPACFPHLHFLRFYNNTDLLRSSPREFSPRRSLSRNRTLPACIFSIYNQTVQTQKAYCIFH